QHPRGAETALERVLLAERLLQRRQRAVLSEALDGLQLVPVDLGGEHQTGADGDAFEDHRAGAADAVLAADVGTGEAEPVAEEVRQEQPRLDGLAPVAPVDADVDVDHALPSSALRRARSTARSTHTPVSC